MPFPFLSPPSPSGEVGRVSGEKGAILGVSSAPSNLLSFCCRSLSTYTDRSLGRCTAGGGEGGLGESGEERTHTAGVGGILTL